MLDFITGIPGMVTGSAINVVLGAAAIVLAYVFRKLPNESIQKVVGGFAYGLGVTVTLGLSKWQWTAPLWNKTIEPYLVDLIDNTVVCFARKFVDGLHSDKS